MKTVSCWLCILTCLAFSAQADERPWFKKHLVGMEIGPTGAQFGHSDPSDGRYCKLFDGAKIVQRARSAGAEYLVAWVRDGDYAYYSSKLLPKAPGLGSRDPLQEAMDEAKRGKFPVIAYCVVQQGGHYLSAHPEWEMHGTDGKPIGRFCFNSGYLTAMKEIVAEQLRYGIAGFHLDMLDQGFGPPIGCWCSACQKKFQAKFGKPMPTGVTWDENWDRMLAFRYETSANFERELRDHIKRINPQATVDFNYHGNPPFSWEVGQLPVLHAGVGDFVTGETGVWGFSALGVGLNAQFYRSANPGQPFQVAMQRGVRMYHDQTTRPLNDIRWELLTLLAHGAFVTMVDKTGFQGELDPVAYERIGKAFAEVDSKRAHFGQTPVADVGLYFSSRSRDWVGREKPMDYFLSFLGAHKALVYEHIPFGVIMSENADLATLGRFPVVLLPNVGILSEKEIALFEQYLQGGGKLIVTGQSGCFDWFGKPANGSSLSKLVGAKLVRSVDTLDNWMSMSAKSDQSHEFDVKVGEATTDWRFLVKGPAVVYEAGTARTIGNLYKPFRTVRQQTGKEGTDWPMSADTLIGPAMLVNTVGKGTVLTFAASPDFATASEHHIVETRRLIRQAVRMLHPKPRLEVIAPANVEVVITDDPASRSLRVHLLGYNSPPQSIPAKDRPFVLPMPIEDAPIYKVSIKSSQDFKSVKAWNSTTVLRRQGSQIDATVDDIHEVLILSY